MDGIRGITIKLDFKNIEIVDEIKIKAEAGALLSKLSNIALNNELTGLEFATGIPGALGGAIRMNAGAYGMEMKDIIDKVTYLDENLEIKTIGNEENEFGYRISRFAKNKKEIVISAVLKLSKGNKEEIKLKMDENMNSRKQKQPIDMPSAGSAFKRENRFYNCRAYRQM